MKGDNKLHAKISGLILSKITDPSFSILLFFFFHFPSDSPYVVWIPKIPHFPFGVKTKFRVSFLLVNAFLDHFNPKNDCTPSIQSPSRIVCDSIEIDQHTSVTNKFYWFLQRGSLVRFMLIR